MAQDIVMVVGLGNPGSDYENTRHNAGALFVEALAREAGQTLRPEKKYHGLYARIQWQGLDLHLLNPSTFMNRSGTAIKALADFFKISPEQILVAHDELDLPPGTAKLKKGGGHGGHNGLRDTIAHLGTNDFQRLRLGIGHPGDSRKVTGFVLGRLGKQETEQLTAVFDEVMRVLPDAASGKLAAAMNRLHSFKPTP
ncbi:MULTISPECIES: aminoacyl-tRNA hydrolase [Marinobacter]|jgi:PTH1 family peptidyl-tRNA hydrolase|uniref:Peptidyl-tRNA hydrolase n=3 Tax=Marinobacter nauticus TaxID=2743 RepID=PTH_MARN8|nr:MULTISPECIES: aminoacyl-tRNA hydrolase [Marinobacter]A1U374.1 RecName: Full=Peptidyl-tRNA hydrolase; Short=PTH [Marinobacter nauticus VT8]MEC8824004.1 aminoacyl-tRNA hydrolase [Pseudomonadota bacterium]ABM19443.1 peptidyl-tRNA hydrolase [Marinobacter nauticus VT8]ERS08307.1 peptidyl-tRNA hydrolase [Marinobacter sp. EN3]MAC21646.1 peptidyl-tRNA hydrolase [Marinobacter sp.]MAH31549.1 peptidyl-tRNA hydrolase [Marinobacter sp.]|tara:strand:- start:2985 stop:3575 length:591 start_codon:yes stop_codon:yes gene_type:complete